MRTRSLVWSGCVAVLTAAALAGCGSDDEAAKDSGADAAPLVVYSGREEELVAPLYEQFEKDTGIELDVRYGETPELVALLQEEGDATPADVFYAQDAGATGSLGDMLSVLAEDDVAGVDERFIDPEMRWSGVTARVRTMIYNTDAMTETELPDSILDLTDPQWKGRLGVAPNNSSFQAAVTAMRLAIGDDKTRAWLEDLAANEPTIYEKNSQIAEAVASGEVDAGLVNHYYLYEIRAEQPDAKVANHFFAPDDVGSFINASALGIVAASDNADAAQTFVQYLLDEGQDFFATEAEEREYPVNADARKQLPDDLPALESISGPDVDLAVLGDELEATVAMIRDSGLGDS